MFKFILVFTESENYIHRTWGKFVKDLDYNLQNPKINFPICGWERLFANIVAYTNWPGHHCCYYILYLLAHKGTIVVFIEYFITYFCQFFLIVLSKYIIVWYRCACRVNISQVSCRTEFQISWEKVHCPSLVSTPIASLCVIIDSENMITTIIIAQFAPGELANWFSIIECHVVFNMFHTVTCQ